MPEMTDASQYRKPVPKQAYKLKHLHRHGGEDQPAGTTIQVTADQAKRIKAAENRIDADLAREKED